MSPKPTPSNASTDSAEKPELRGQIVHAKDAPDNTGTNIGNFSQAVRVGDTVYIGGTLAIDQHAQSVIDSDPFAAMRRAFANLKLICEEAGTSLGDICHRRRWLVAGSLSA